jgi:hypothetical protein
MLHPAWTLLPGLLLAAGTRPAVAQLAARDSAYLATTTQALLDAITAAIPPCGRGTSPRPGF